MNKDSIFDELDHAIHALIADPAKEPSGQSPDLAGLLQVASDLRQLPRPDFKIQLKRELDWLAAARPLSPARPVTADILPSLFAKGQGTFPVRQINFAVSLAVHAAAMVLILALGTMAIKESKNSPKPHVISLADYVPPLGAVQPRGGGSGGDRDPLDASRGTPPRAASEQLTPPVVVIRNPDPKLPAEPTIIAPNLRLPQTSQLGDPLSRLMTPSSGPGVRGGIGSNTGGGVGINGDGPGYGPGSGGNSDGHAYRVGNGINAPRVIYDPEPEYSPEARAAKYQGTVTLWAIVAPDGRPRGLRVERSLGMGLDEKALEAVNTWRFDPATKDGHPVPVMIEIEVSFHLY